MTKEELYHALSYVNHSREKRLEMAQLVQKNPDLVPILFEIAFTIDDPISSRACWVLEFTAKETIDFIFPYLDTFTENCGLVHLDSSVRPMAKICEYLIIAYYSKEKDTVQDALNKLHLERISAVCFDWLITDQKVAPQAYAMTCLLLLGRTFAWIHPELKLVLERNYALGSAAYKARARMTLEKLT